MLGLSVLSGAHLDIARAVIDELARQGAGEIPIVVGGIIPDDDVAVLGSLGVKAVFTPKDYDVVEVMNRILDVIGAPQAAAGPQAASG